jgi:hypothetical protein
VPVPEPEPAALSIAAELYDPDLAFELAAVESDRKRIERLRSELGFFAEPLITETESDAGSPEWTNRGRQSA